MSISFYIENWFLIIDYLNIELHINFILFPLGVSPMTMVIIREIIDQEVCINSSNRVIISGTLLKIYKHFLFFNTMCGVLVVCLWFGPYHDLKEMYTDAIINKITFEVRQIYTIAFVMHGIVLNFWPNCRKVKGN